VLEVKGVGEPTWLLDRIDYRSDPEYRGSFDANPYHTQPARS